jgi:CheY-like chemotaxis protein
LLDINLPKVDGLEVLQAIKQDPNLHVIPVVMFTSSREARDVTSSYELGASAYVVKPLVFNDLQAVIQKIAEFWLIVNEPFPDGAE